MSIQNPDLEKIQEVSERELASFSVLKKTESQTWGRKGVKKNRVQEILGLCFFNRPGVAGAVLQTPSSLTDPV